MDLKTILDLIEQSEINKINQGKYECEIYMDEDELLDKINETTDRLNKEGNGVYIIESYGAGDLTTSIQFMRKKE